MVKNVYDCGQAAGQWLMLGGKWKFELVPINNAAAPYLPADLLSAPKVLPIT